MSSEPTTSSSTALIAALSAGAVALTAFATFKAYKAGFFAKLVVEEKTMGPFLMLYTNHQAPYRTAHESFRELMSKVVSGAALVHQGEACLAETAGFFYDDPKTTKPENCRFSACYVHKTRRELQGGAEVLERHQELLHALSVVKTGELKVGLLPETRCLVVRHPYTGSMLSIISAVWRAYPLLMGEARRKLSGQQLADVMAQGFFELYCPRLGCMYITLPLTKRSSMLPPALQFAGASK